MGKVKLERKGRVKIIVICLFLSLQITLLRGEEILSSIPKPVDTVYHLRHLDTNAGWKEILAIYRKNLEQKQQDPNYLLLNYLLRQFTFKEIAGGILRVKNEDRHLVLILPKLDGDKERFNRFLIENLGNLVGLDKQWQKKDSSSGEISYHIQGETNEKLTAFAVLQERVFLASNSQLVEKILATQAKSDGIGKSPWHKLFFAKNIADYDGFMCIDNRQRCFTSKLKEWETKNKLKVLLSSDFLDGLSVSFILKSADKVQGRIIFLCSDPAKVALVNNDAQFLGEVARRKFMYAHLDYKSKVAVEGNTVILDFELNNIKSVLEKELQ